MKTLLSFIIFSFLAFGSYASITTAISSGDWDEAGNWDNGDPGCFDTIIIPAGIQMDITTTVNLEACPGDSIIIYVWGRIEFQNGRKLKLPCDSDVIIYPGGSVGVGSGGGSSTYIEICGSQYWNASGGDLSGPTELCDGGCPPPTTLPVRLVNFEAIYNESLRCVELFWRTMSETDNDYFTVERSADAKTWEFVCKTQGAGNSVSILTYLEADYNPLNGFSYYRLKQTDFNGDFEFSPIVSVVQNSAAGLLVYPNPISSNQQLVVSFPEPKSGIQLITICDLAGKRIFDFSRDVSDVKQVVLTLPDHLASGSYYIFSGDQKTRFVVR